MVFGYRSDRVAIYTRRVFEGKWRSHLQKDVRSGITSYKFKYGADEIRCFYKLFAS